MAEFSIDGTAYESRMLDGMAQASIMKRLLPTFATLMGVSGSLAGAGAAQAGDDANEPPESTAANTHDILLPVARELSALSDADLAHILDACVDVTKRQVAGGGIGWVDVRQRGLIQSDADKTMRRRLLIAWHVLGENFADVARSFGIDLAGAMDAAAKGVAAKGAALPGNAGRG